MDPKKPGQLLFQNSNAGFVPTQMRTVSGVQGGNSSKMSANPGLDQTMDPPMGEVSTILPNGSVLVRFTSTSILSSYHKCEFEMFKNAAGPIKSIGIGRLQIRDLTNYIFIPNQEGLKNPEIGDIVCIRTVQTQTQDNLSAMEKMASLFRYPEG